MHNLALRSAATLAVLLGVASVGSLPAASAEATVNGFSSYEIVRAAPVSSTAAVASPATQPAGSQSFTIGVSMPGCVIDVHDLAGWWTGDGTLDAVVGPALTGHIGFARGLIGQAFVFDETSDVTVGMPQQFGEAFTLEAWLKPAALDHIATIVSVGDVSASGASDAFAFTLSPSGTLRWESRDAGSDSPHVLVADAPELFDRGYHHVAVTRDSEVATLYLDGVAIALGPSAGSSFTSAAGAPLRIGGGAGPAEVFGYVGRIDEMAIGKWAFAAGEIAALAAAGPKAKCLTKR